MNPGVTTVLDICICIRQFDYILVSVRFYHKERIEAILNKQKQEKSITRTLPTKKDGTTMEESIKQRCSNAYTYITGIDFRLSETKV